MKKIILILMLGIFLLSFASASCPDGDDCITGSSAIALYDEIEIYQTCNNCTYCNFTKIKYPNKTVFLSNIEATQDGTHYNYNVLGGNHTELGEYEYCYDCGNAVERETGCLHYLVTPSGEVGKSFLLNPILIFLTIFAFIFIGLGIGLKIPPLGFIGAILLVLAGMYTMIYGFGDVTNLYTRGVAISLIGLGFIFIISSAYEWLTEEG